MLGTVTLQTKVKTVGSNMWFGMQKTPGSSKVGYNKGFMWFPSSLRSLSGKQLCCVRCTCVLHFPGPEECGDDQYRTNNGGNFFRIVRCKSACAYDLTVTISLAWVAPSALGVSNVMSEDGLRYTDDSQICTLYSHLTLSIYCLRI